MSLVLLLVYLIVLRWVWLVPPSQPKAYQTAHARGPVGGVLSAKSNPSSIHVLTLSGGQSPSGRNTTCFTKRA